uniref:Ig-like domain-containing protein n=1 Tax=Steinernema glaseri TaxID=37863 RepID=A0A1I7Z074_9BILA
MRKQHYDARRATNPPQCIVGPANSRGESLESVERESKVAIGQMILLKFTVFLLLWTVAGGRRKILTSREVICQRLEMAERIKLIQSGDCPNITAEATTQPPKAPKKLESGGKGLLKRVNRKAKIITVNLTQGMEEMYILEGVFLVLNCTVQRNDTVEWYFNRDRIKGDGWRVQKNGTSLRIQPLVSGKDEGSYQCFMHGVLKGSIDLHVMTTKDALKMGMFNYLAAMAFAAPVLLLIVIVNNEHEVQQTVGVDPMAGFYEEQLNVTEEAFKVTLRDSAAADRKAIEHPQAVSRMHTIKPNDAKTVDPAQRTNMHTVMTIVDIGEQRNAMTKAKPAHKSLSSR